MLVSQHQPLVESFFHQPDGAWLFNVSKGMAFGLTLRSLDVTVPLAEIYAGVTWSGKGPT